ncbi:FAD-dependent oxidoreductase [Salinicola endophyticus]|uniref:FAD-dependent oxidoreductase n=1 Tax=Salinicola endophyticus TaxID=1949083 RepID=A0AB74U8Q7_9GAMM
MSDATPSSPRQQLLLVGNGDAHLHVASHARELAQAGIDVTLITPQPFAFADWLGGMLGGEWQLDDVRLPAARITAHGATHVAASVVAADRGNRRVTLDDGQHLDYDWLSIDLPAVVDAQAIPGFYTAQGVYGASADSLWALRQQLESELADPARRLPSVAVLGGGALGVELAANLLALGERYGRPLPVALIGNERQPLPDACRRANRWLTRRLQRRGLRLELVATAARYERDSLILDDGTAVDADLLLVVEALRPPPAFEVFGLAHDAQGRVEVDPRQRSREDPRVFVNQASAPGEPTRRATRERGASLLAALLALGDAPTPARAHASQWKALNLGDLRDIAWRGSLWCRGRWVRRLKHRRDRREVARYLDDT